jgi:hypothetical protein
MRGVYDNIRICVNGVDVRYATVAYTPISCLFSCRDMIGGDRYDAFLMPPQYNGITIVSEFKAHDHVISFVYTGIQQRHNVNCWCRIRMSVQFHTKAQFNHICDLLYTLNPKYVCG